MIFSKLTTLNFTGLCRIQTDLDHLYPQAYPSDCLVVTASLPSLKAEEKTELLSMISAHNQIIFWCYGDLVWNVPFWQSIERSLIGKRVTWAVASQRWKKVAEKFIPEENLSLISHPFDVQRPALDRDRIRKNYGWKEEDKVLIYAGRRSQQKNLPLLWKLWHEMKSRGQKNLKLVLAGDWCDYGIPQTPELRQPIHSQKNTWEQLKLLFPEDLIDLGRVESKSLSEILLAADCVVSLSTFLEEDFGLAVREARLLATPVLATDWGGHADLQDEGSFLIPVSSQGLIDLQQAGRLMGDALSAPRREEDYRPAIEPRSFDLRLFKGLLATNQLEINEWKKLMSGFDH